ncbi:S-adenosyl-L-methionine-dependent methyltransferase, partial [Lophiostoma macrostomum CBS 122681]
MASSEEQGETYEAEHVHSVYEEIASHFSSTRYKPWPIVERFLKDLQDGSIGVDVGCGNGKYLAVNPNVFIVGSDRSTNLIRIAKTHRPHSAIVADNLSLPHPLHTFDFAISIAVIHHLSTPARRIEAVDSILSLLKPNSSSTSEDGGRALIYVWALEQKDSRRGWDEGHVQDVMVPWVMKGKKEKAPRQKHKQAQDKTFLRYYHLYRKGELEHDIEEAGGVVLEAGYEKDNWWAIARR